MNLERWDTGKEYDRLGLQDRHPAAGTGQVHPIVGYPETSLVVQEYDPVWAEHAAVLVDPFDESG